MSIVTTFWRDSGLPPALLYCVLLLVVTAAANLIVRGLHAVLVHLFPIPQTLDELAEDWALQNRYRQDLKRIGVIEAVLTRVGLVLGPFAFWYAAQFFIKLVSADGDFLLYPGAAAMAIPNMIAGALIGVAIVPLMIFSRWAFPHAEVLVRLYQRSEDRHGRMGRVLVRRPLSVAFVLVAGATVLLGNNYTLVGRERVEISGGSSFSSRQTLENKKISGLFHVVQEKAGGGRVNEYFVVYTNGRLLSSKDHLSGWGRRPLQALEILSSSTKLPIRRMTKEQWIAERARWT